MWLVLDQSSKGLCSCTGARAFSLFFLFSKSHVLVVRELRYALRVSGVISRARWMLHAYRDFDARRLLAAARTNGLGAVSEDSPEKNASTTLVPSSGFVGLYFLLQASGKALA